MKKYYLLFASLPFLATGCAFAAGPLGLGIVSAAVISLSIAFAACDDSSSSKKGAAPSANKIFVTLSSTDGDFGGASEADAICTSDTNNPGDDTVFKAMIAGGGRDTTTDWVLKANTEYTRLDNTVIGTTNSSSVFTAPLTNTWSGAHTYAWTGLTNDWQSGAACDNWSRNTNDYTAFIGYANSNTSGAWSYIGYRCDYVFHFICVGQ